MPEIENNPFLADSPYVHSIRADAHVIAFDIEEIRAHHTKIDCGTPVMTFTTITGDELDADLFTYDEIASEFIINKTEDSDKIGDYDIIFNYFYAQDPTVSVESDVFTVVVVDLCMPPAGYEKPVLTPPEIEPIELTIGSDEKITYSLPPWTVAPVYCEELIEVSATYDVDLPPELAAGFEFDGLDFTFALPEVDNLPELAGFNLDGLFFPFEIQAELGDLLETFDFGFNMKNPCVDERFYKVIVADEAADFTYTLYSETDNVWTHTPFKIEAMPRIEQMCGTLVYSVDLGDLLKDAITYNIELSQLTIYSDDRQLLEASPIPYSIKVELEMYPGFGTGIEEGLITIVDPCGSPIRFEADD